MTKLVTFLLTDVEGSTALWETDPDAMSQALQRHDEIVADAVARHGGTLVKPRGEGDSTFSVFTSATGAVAAALDLQVALADETWPPDVRIVVRAGLHTGESHERHGDWYGQAPNRAARIRALGHGGQTLMSSTTAALVREKLPVGAQLSDLGPHRLTGIAGSERIWQLDHPRLRSDFAPLRSIDPAGLPARLTSFVGSEDRLAAVEETLSGSRLVTLTGPGGVGKTRLAVEVSVRTSDRYPGGLWMVDLSRISDPSLVWPAVASATRTPETEGSTIADAVRDRLGLESTLVLLDNCEHVLRSAAEVASALLEAVPSVRILATSRQNLGVQGEAVFEVDPLPLPEGDPAASEAVRLFVERARLADPGFDPGPRMEAIARIVTRLDGMPLAIELAASRVRVLSPEDIDTRLADRFRLLVGPRTAPERVRSLRATVEWSYELLEPQDRTLFARLSVFAAPWTLERAERVCGAELDVLTGVSRLVERSLVQADRSGPVTRFRMLETIRAYAAEQLVASGEQDAVRDAHLAWCAEEAAAVQPAIRTGDVASAYERLDDLMEDVRTALEHAVLSGALRTGLQLSSDVHRLWLTRGQWTEGQRWLELFAGAPDASPLLNATGLVALARFAQARSDHIEARRLAEEATELLDREDDVELRVKAMLVIGHTEHAQGRPEEAERHYTAALHVAEQMGAGLQTADALAAIGSVAQLRGDYPQARERYTAALSLYHELDIPPDGKALYALGSVELAQGNEAEARALYEEGLQTAQRAGDRRVEAALLEGLGRLDEVAGRLESALDRFTQSLQLERELGDPIGIAASLYVTGNVLRRLGSHREAGEALEEAQRLAAARGAAPVSAAVTLERGWLEMEEGRTDLARACFTDALDQLRSIGNRRGVVIALESIAALPDTDPALAAMLYGHAATERERIGAPVEPSEIDDHTARLDRVRTALGDGFSQAWADGQRSTLSDVLSRLGSYATR